MNVMIDLETLGTRINSVVLTLGAIKFFPTEEHGINENNHFYMKISRESCKELGLVEYKDTLDWWEKQSTEAREEAFSEKDRYPIRTVLESFSKWFGDSKNVWSQGANFDIPILSEIYARLGMVEPWKYYNVRDTRTVYSVSCLNMKNIPTKGKHHALEDCKNQIWAVKESYQLLIQNKRS